MLREPPLFPEKASSFQLENVIETSHFQDRDCSSEDMTYMQVICTYQADPAVGSGGIRSQGGALVSMYMCASWFFTEDDALSDPSNRHQSTTQFLLLDIDIATGNFYILDSFSELPFSDCFQFPLSPFWL